MNDTPDVDAGMEDSAESQLQILEIKGGFKIGSNVFPECVPYEKTEGLTVAKTNRFIVACWQLLEADHGSPFLKCHQRIGHLYQISFHHCLTILRCRGASSPHHYLC